SSPSPRPSSSPTNRPTPPSPCSGGRFAPRRRETERAQGRTSALSQFLCVSREAPSVLRTSLLHRLLHRDQPRLQLPSAREQPVGLRLHLQHAGVQRLLE